MNLEFKGTKGDWIKTGNALADNQRLIETNTHLICRLDGASFDTDEEMDANAKLIAAAPELLEALQMTKMLNLQQYEKGTVGNRVYEAINKAIEKALK